MPLMRRLFAGMLTRSDDDSGTNSRIALRVSDHGIQRLDHTFPDTAQEDQETGGANLYSIDVATNNIVSENLDNFSIQVGIRGGDQWRPEHFVVWGEAVTSGAVVPLAIETDMDVELSTEEGEGEVFAPLRLVGSGGQSMAINRLLLMMTTADVEDAGTDSTINLRVTTRQGASVVDFDLPETPQEEQERAQANLYFVPVDFPFTKNDLNVSSVRLSIKGSDAWLPSSCFLFGLDDAGGRPEFLVPLVHLRTWLFGWLSTDSSEGSEFVGLPLA